MTNSLLSNETIDAIVAGRHSDVFAHLGLHKHGTAFIARAFVPGATKLVAQNAKGKVLGEMRLLHEDGLFAATLDVKSSTKLTFQASNADGSWSINDPYCFGPVLGPGDDYYLSEGTHLQLHEKMGAHLMTHEGTEGVHFAVWAPNARRVAVIGTFNHWDGRVHVMRKRLGTGVWEIFIPGLAENTLYKFELLDHGGKTVTRKADPFAFAAELRPNTASKISDINSFKWTDAKYLKGRAKRDHRRLPMSIYEVHLGSWKRGPDNRFLTYHELAADLIPYVKAMAFTHIELLPISEHPYDPSWGYQPTGLYAPTARFGDPSGFAHFVDVAHAAGIGIILDWVPAHFPTDAFGLARFDGTALYEHEDPRLGFHPDWNTLIYNFGRTEVQSFLINNALFWFDKYHIDGLRVDAVASMLYLDYSRKDGEWLPNKNGGNENLEAIAFLRRMNEVCYAAHPGIMTIAEESTAFPGVSQPTSAGGLGFGFKWNMGFMHDTLEYLSRDPVHRRHHHSEITFGLLYAFSENFVLPLSHDEVVHGKGSLLKKMGGDEWAKFAGLRAYYGLMWAHPGKKLLFMGQEFAPWDEWTEKRSLDWHLTNFDRHGGMQKLVKDLNHAYAELGALHGRDCEGEGFNWLIGDDQENSVFAWARFSDGTNPVVMISNLTPVLREGYSVPMPKAGLWIERINTDAEIYGGTGKGNSGVVIADQAGSKGQPASAMITLPPMATLILEYQKQ